MKSFYFWLTIAAACGALLATILRPGILEIAIVVVIANLAYNAYRRITRTQVVEF